MTGVGGRRRTGDGLAQFADFSEKSVGILRPHGALSFGAEKSRRSRKGRLFIENLPGFNSETSARPAAWPPYLTSMITRPVSVACKGSCTG